MTKDDRRKLLKMTDLEIGLRDDTSLASFVAGFRLAWGIMAELGTKRPTPSQTKKNDGPARP
jgi:hypothetical protein